MLLSANFGALKGYLIGAAAFWGFVFVLTVIWVFGLPGTPALTGPKGTDPSFKQFQLNSSVAARYTAAQQFQGAASNGWKEEPVEPVGGAKLPTDQETLRADLETAKQAIQQDLITDFNKDGKEPSKGSGLEKPTFAPKTFFAYRDPGAPYVPSLIVMGVALVLFVAHVAGLGAAERRRPLGTPPRTPAESGTRVPASS